MSKTVYTIHYHAFMVKGIGSTANCICGMSKSNPFYELIKKETE